MQNLLRIRIHTCSLDIWVPLRGSWATETDNDDDSHDVERHHNEADTPEEYHVPSLRGDTKQSK